MTSPGLPGLIEELRWRGMFHEATPGLEARLASGRPIAGYNGFDPTGASLHIGHLVPIFGLIRFQRRGGRPVALVGGATGMVGDPSGRSIERNLLDRDVLIANVASIRAQLARFLDFAPGPAQAQLVNNLEWTEDVRVLDFLRDVGKHFTLPYMLAKESVQLRLERGLSFTEFSYMLLQAFDFQHLFVEHGVELQMGGADQWGNITAGLELIRRTEGSGGVGAGEPSELAHGLAYPLLLTPSGSKFGKTEGGDSVWLDGSLTSPYAFYQYWLNTDDRDVGVYLRWFTLFERDEIEALEAEHEARPEARTAQRALARDLTARVHGADEAQAAIELSEAIFSGRLGELSAALLEAAAHELPHALVVAGADATAGGLALAAGAYGSNGELRRGVAGGGLYVNDVRVTDANGAPPAPLHGRFWIVRTGKRNQRIVERSG